MIKIRKDNKGITLRRGEYQRKDGTYEYRHTDFEEKKHSEYADKLSQLRVIEYTISMKESVSMIRDLRNVTLNDQFNIWISTKMLLRENTRNDYRFMYDSYVKNGLGKKYLNEITTFDIKCHYNSLIVNRRISVETVAHVQNIVYQIFQSAKESGALLNNPADRAIKDFKRHHRKHSNVRKGLTKDQESTFLLYLKTSKEFIRWYPVFYIMAKTGLRLSEIIGLRWCDINLEKQVIDVNHALVYYAGADGKADYHVHSPKTDSGIREIPFDLEVLEALELEKKNQEKDHICCLSVVDSYTDFVFLNRFGNVHNQSSLNRALTRIAENYNATQMYDESGKDEFLPHFSCHVLRHTYANRLCEDGVNVKVMQRLLGHSDIGTTMEIYTDVSQKFMEDEFFDKVRGKRRDK